MGTILNRHTLRNLIQLGKETMPTKLIVDCSTGVTTEVELTAEEIAQREADAAAFAEAKAIEEAEAQAKLAEKEAIAAKLGLTPEELLKLLS